MSSSSGGNMPWNKKKKATPSNTPSELHQDFSSRPQAKRSKSSQSVLKNNALTIPEDNFVSHTTGPSLPRFTPIGSSSNLQQAGLNAAANANAGGAPADASQDADALSSFSANRRRQRADSVERDANAFITSNIDNGYDDIGVDRSDDEEETAEGTIPAAAPVAEAKIEQQQEENRAQAGTTANEEVSSDSQKTATGDDAQAKSSGASTKKKREVVFYDSDSDSSANHVNKEKEKVTDNEARQNTDTLPANATNNNNDADVTSVSSDSHAANFLTKLLSFKHGKRSNVDEEKQIGFDMSLFSDDRPSRLIKRTNSNDDDDGEDDQGLSSDEEREQIHQEVANIMNSHTSKLSRFLRKKNKPAASKKNGQLSRSSSKSSLSDLFYSSHDPTKANGAIVNRNSVEDEHPDEVMKDRLAGDEYVPPPPKVQDGVLASLMKLYNLPQAAESSATMVSEDGTTLNGGGSSQMGLGESSTFSQNNLDSEINNSQKLASHMSEENLKVNGKGQGNAPSSDKLRHSGGSFFKEMPSFKSSMTPQKKASRKNKLAKQKLEARITVHLANLLQRKNFILKICTALMIYGAPPHRLEEYMVMTSRVLEIDGQFMYFPGCMIVAFNDPSTKTTEMQLVRTKEGLNLSKLHDTHQIYKAVIHDVVGVDEASKRLDTLMEAKPLYPPWVCVLLYGFGSSMVCPFAFNGNWVDMPICFLIGCCVGFLQFYVAPRSASYSNVFEVAASIVVSFLGRAIGSINGGKLFCFSALVQGPLALILPGFIILTGSLELQSRNIVNGSVRMFYAIVYSLFLSFGITIGAALYGWLDHDATSNQTCVYKKPLSPWFRFLFVPMFSLTLSLINQASWRQLPVQVSIACSGYVISYFSSRYFANSSEFCSALAAFIIGLLGNLYSRFFKGLAISAMLPAIFVQVPSGLASQSSLLAGVSSANQIVASLNGSSAATTTSEDSSNSLSFGFSMIQVVIGISVGLFTASIIVYPFGKKKTALFTL